MTQQHKNLDLALDLYRSVDAQNFERAQGLVDGKLVEHYGDLDSAGLMQQLMQQGAA